MRDTALIVSSLFWLAAALFFIAGQPGAGAANCGAAVVWLTLALS